MTEEHEVGILHRYTSGWKGSKVFSSTVRKGSNCVNERAQVRGENLGKGGGDYNESRENRV